MGFLPLACLTFDKDFSHIAIFTEETWYFLFASFIPNFYAWVTKDLQRKLFQI